MEKTAVQKESMKKSISIDSILMKAAQDPFKTFEEWPLLDVRRKCLEVMSDERNYCYSISPGTADWAEKAIDDLVVNNDAIVDELVQWYLFRPKDEDIIARALKFVIGLKAKNQIWYGYERTSKLIAGRVKKDTEKFECKYLCPMPVFLKNYIKEIFNEFKEDGQSRAGYDRSDWHCLERALRIISDVKDFSLLPEIEKIILLYQERKIYSVKWVPFFERDLHLAMLKSVRKYLYAARKDSIKNGE